MKKQTLLPLVVLLLCGGVSPAQVYEWRPIPHDQGTLALLENGRQIGVYYILEDTYRARLPGGGWSGPMHSPIRPPKRNFGIEENNLHQGSHYTLNGKQVGREVIEQALQESGVKPREIKGDSDDKKKIPDDSSKQRVTVIGSKEQTEQVLKDFQSHEALKPFKDKLLVAAYEPTHWSITRQGFATTGKPTIYVQDVDGTVLHRQDDYEGGAEALARALRQIDPDYQKEKDRDRRKVLPLLKFPNLPWSLLVVGGLVLAVLITFRRK